MLTGEDIVLDHPHIDWSTQSQHLFRDNLRSAAARLIVDDEDRAFVVDYARFQREVPDLEDDSALRDLALIFRRCGENVTENPVFWLRLVGYAYACNELIAAQGVAVGFEHRPLPVRTMLSAADDEHISARIPEYAAEFDAILAMGL